MKKQRAYIAIILPLVVVLLPLVGTLVVIRADYGWTCSYTGSGKGHTEWFGIVKTSEWYRRSPIEEWLAKNNRRIDHNWIKTRGTGYSLSGVRIRSHARAPGIYYFLPELQERFVRSSSTKEIEDLLKVLKEGSPDENRDVIRKLNDKLIEGM